MKGEEERLRLQRRVDEVERERGRREQVLQSAMSALHVSMQQIDHASHMPTVLHATTTAAMAVAEFARPATPAVTAVAPPQLTVIPTVIATMAPAASPVIQHIPIPIASIVAPQPAAVAVVNTEPPTEPDRHPVASAKPTLRPALSITVPQSSPSAAAAAATTPTAASRQPATPTTPAASSASAILAALRNKPPPAAFNKRTASAPPRQQQLEVEVEVDLGSGDDAEDWEREMEAEMGGGGGMRDRKGGAGGKAVVVPRGAVAGLAGRKVVERVKEEEEVDEDVDVDVEFSEEDYEEEEEQKQPISASSGRSSKVQTKGGVPHVRRY